MFPIFSIRNTAQRKRADSHSTDDYSYVPEGSRKYPPSSPIHSCSLLRSTSRHTDIPDDSPSRIIASFSPFRNPSAQSSPVTSPSAHDGSSRFADSQSSLTSESVGAELSRSGCEDGNRAPAIMRPPNFGTPPSPLPGRSRSITESDLRTPMHGSTRKTVLTHLTSSRPRTAPHSPSSVVTAESSDSHTPMDIKFLLSKPALPLPTRLSLHTSSASEASPPSRHAVPRKSRPHPIELDVSASPFSPGHSYPDHTERLLASQDSLQSPSSSFTSFRGGEQKQRNVLRRKPSAKEKERMRRETEKKRGETTTPSSSAHGPVSVTIPKPTHSQDQAIILGTTDIQAYEQRENLLPVQDLEARVTDEPVSSSPIPYYTVYGTPSEHKVAADLHDTRQWLLHEHVLVDQRTQTRQEEPNRSLARKGSLSRMVSSRWKKASVGAGKADESRLPSHGHSKSRSSLQERRPSRDRSESIHTTQFGTDLHQTRSVTEPRSDLKEEPVEGSKIWRLVKRISTGGMRERFIADKAAPPVPAIPKELLSSASPQSQALRSEPQNLYCPSTPKNIANSGPRPSMATSSSSPNSSDVASAHFFQKSHSRRSSISSYGEETAPTSSFPSMAQGDPHIVPSPEQQIASHREKHPDFLSRSRRCSLSGQAALGAESTNLDDLRPHVVPPVDNPWEMSPRTVHMSSGTQLTSLRTHKLGVRPPMVAHAHMSLSPPPRPARSVMRPSRASRPATADGSLASRTSLRASSTLSEGSTITLQPLSNSLACTSEGKLDASHLRSGVNFRELNATPRRAPLTEREKTKIWNDLLERSEQAGGTLHLGASSQLESDNLRYSTCSEVSRS